MKTKDYLLLTAGILLGVMSHAIWTSNKPSNSANKEEKTYEVRTIPSPVTIHHQGEILDMKYRDLILARQEANTPSELLDLLKRKFPSDLQMHQKYKHEKVGVLMNLIEVHEFPELALLLYNEDMSTWNQKDFIYSSLGLEWHERDVAGLADWIASEQSPASSQLFMNVLYQLKYGSGSQAVDFYERCIEQIGDESFDKDSVSKGMAKQYVLHRNVDEIFSFVGKLDAYTEMGTFGSKLGNMVPAKKREEFATRLHKSAHVFANPEDHRVCLNRFIASWRRQDPKSLRKWYEENFETEAPTEDPIRDQIFPPPYSF